MDYVGFTDRHLYISPHQRKRTLNFVDLETLRACLHGVGDAGLVGLVSFVFTLWGKQNKRNLPH